MSLTEDDAGLRMHLDGKNTFLRKKVGGGDMGFQKLETRGEEKNRNVFLRWNQ